MAKTIKLKKKEMKALKEQIEEDEGSADEWFKEVTLGIRFDKKKIESVLKKKYGINSRVTHKGDEIIILASAYTKKERKSFDKFLADIAYDSKVIKECTEVVSIA